jgi:serine/threonine protein kinase
VYVDIELPYPLSACQDLIRQCLAFDGAERATLDDILRHPWMAAGEFALPPTTAELNGGRHKLASVPTKLATHAIPHPVSRMMAHGTATGSHQAGEHQQLQADHGNAAHFFLAAQQQPGTSSASGGASSMPSASMSCGHAPGKRKPEAMLPSNCSSAFSSSSSSGYGTSAASPPNGSLMLGSY